ncbi:hypothetical protein [uncultured Nostoc sp.]|uniref:hypothetical protein n=1 Tax=uncultured Nostoc sp. TaxID=340711 RepID=UPI002604D6EA|nr:hypothetical protein [uncultured Nostoc sp.]
MLSCLGEFWVFIIDYVLWLQKNELQFFPNAILISAVREQWKPKVWRDEYLELPRSAIGTGIGGGMPQFRSGSIMNVIG